MGPRMFFMLKKGLEFITGRINPMKHQDEVLEIELELEGNTTKIRLGYDGMKLIIAVLPEDSMQLPSFVHVHPNQNAEK